MIHAHFIDDAFEGFFDDAITAEIPAGAVEISDALHDALLAGLADGRPVILVEGAPTLGAGRDPLERAREIAVGRVEQRIIAYAATFSAGVPREEVSAWSTKAAHARAHLDGTPSALILAEAEVLGEDPVTVATRIVARADGHELIVVRLTGLRTLALRQLAVAADTAEIDAILDLTSFGPPEAPRTLETVITDLAAREGRTLDLLPDLP